MKKIILMLVFVLGTGTLMNANNSNDLINVDTTFEVVGNVQGSSFELMNGETINLLNINEQFVASLEIAAGMTCDEWSSFAMNWYYNVLGYSFQDAAREADRVYQECIGEVQQ